MTWIENARPWPAWFSRQREVARGGSYRGRPSPSFLRLLSCRPAGPSVLTPDASLPVATLLPATAGPATAVQVDSLVPLAGAHDGWDEIPQ